MKEYKLKKEEIIRILPYSKACIASLEITKEGKKVGYMYREEPTNETDSGWRFFSGLEEKEYTENQSNFEIYDLNTICNYDQSILPYLEEKIGSKLEKVEGKFKKVSISSK